MKLINPDDFYFGALQHVLFMEDIDKNRRVKVRHAHWIIHFRRGGYIEPSFMCSSCGKRSWSRTNYCPYCGALMDEEENNDDG